MKVNQIKYLGFGSPLMDMIFDITQEQLLKFDLKLDNSIQMKTTETKAFTALERECSMNLQAGGCSYNAMRVFKWMLDESTEGEVGVLGAVGKDKYGEKYKKLLKNENIQYLFEEVDFQNTGLCLVYCYNKERGHITDLGASISITQDFFNSQIETLKKLELVYTELFILKHKREMVYALAELMLNENNKIFGFNIPSFYFIENFLSDIKNLIGYAEIVFSNAAEARFLAKLLDFKYDNISDIVEFLCRIPKKNKNKKRIFVITCGPQPAYITEYDFNKEEFTFKESFEPNEVPEEKIVDANGAGDAFAGGFLSQLVQGKNLTCCVKAGHYAAGKIIQERGCHIPKICDFK